MRSRLSVLMVLLLNFLVFGQELGGKSLPSARIRLPERTMTVGHFFRSIEEQTRFFVVYSEAQVSTDSLVRFSRTEGTLVFFLNEFSRQTGWRYDYSKRYIIVSRYAPGRLIRGQVLDEGGHPVSGADVLEWPDRKHWAATDPDGWFEIVVGKKDRLSVSCLGYKSTVAEISDTLKVVLREDVSPLDDAVVIGYGRQRRTDLTGAISSVKMPELRDIPAHSVAEALQGKVAGVYVNRGRGPGASADIFIRGAGSINGLKPLYVIDGMPGGGELGWNINDVESIEVIKDASAAAIYGANAAGGVILITTKGGHDAEPRVSFSAKTGLTRPGRPYELLHTQDYIAARMEATDAYDLLWDDPGSLPDTDWARELNLYGTGWDTEYSLSLSARQGRMAYYLSGSFADEEGLQTDFWRNFYLFGKFDYSVTPRLKVGTWISAWKTNWNDNAIGWRTLWRSIPYMNVYEEDGSFSPIPSSSPFTACRNYVAELSYGDHQRKGRTRSEARLSLEWNMTDALRLSFMGNAFFSSEYDNVYQEQTYTRRTNVSDQLTMKASHAERYRFFSTLTYEKALARDHDLLLMAGYEAWLHMDDKVSVSGQNSMVSDPQSMSMTSEYSRTGDGLSEWNGRGLSQFARLNYSYRRRLLLSLNLRRDGSTKFGSSYRFGWFPSASVGWKIHEEPFFRRYGSDWIDVLKPRLSYGSLGNTDALSDYMWQAAYSAGIGSYSFDGTASGRESGFSMVKLINDDIKWEEIVTADAGLDIALFGKRFSASIDWYDRRSKDMLYNLRVPSTSGSSGTMPVNLGSIQNRGIEGVFSWSDRKADFQYAISVNLAHNVNRVLNLGQINARISDGDLSTTNGNSVLSTGSDTHVTVNGQPIGAIWGFQTAGIISSTRELEDLNALAREKGFAFYQTADTGVGDLRYVDRNKDGHISKEDATFLGSPWPDLQYGGTCSAIWKGWDLAVSWAGIQGRDVVNCMKPFEYVFQTDYQTTRKIFETSFMSGNGLTDYPRAYASQGDGVVVDPNGNYNLMSDFLMEDGSYLRIKDIVIGYTLPARWSRKWYMDRCRLYFDGSNLLTFTRFTGLDPEFRGSVTKYGSYLEGIPMMRTYTFGLNIVFGGWK